MERLLKLADIRNLNKKVSLGEITSLRMVEIINEMAFIQMCKGIESFKEKQAKFLLEFQKDNKNQKWISLKEKDLSHLKEGDIILTLDEKLNIIPYKYFLGGLNMIGEHSDNNRKITHFIELGDLPISTTED